MVKLIKKFFSNYFNFSGKTTVKEFWITFLSLMLIGFIMLILYLVVAAIGMFAETPGIFHIMLVSILVLMILFGLAIFIPSLAMWCRRLRDGGFPPSLLLIAIIPGIGGLILFILSFMPSK